MAPFQPSEVDQPEKRGKNRNPNNYCARREESCTRQNQQTRRSYKILQATHD